MAIAALAQRTVEFQCVDPIGTDVMNSQIENRTAGIFWMLATMACFIALDSTMKIAMETYPVLQVSWARFFFATLTVALVSIPKIPKVFLTANPGLQLLRSIMLGVTTGFFNSGIKTVPLPTGTTIMFMSPIIITLLAGVFLNERVGWRRWSGIFVGFCGALVVIRIWETGLSGINQGALLLLAAAFSNAVYQTITRRLRNDDPMTTLLYAAMAGAVVTSFLVPYQWKAPDVTGWVLFVVSGLCGYAGHFCLIKAFNNAPASVVAPFSYSSLVWATLAGIVIWNDWPVLSTLIGAALIIASGLYIFMREQKRGSKTAAEAAVTE